MTGLRARWRPRGRTLLAMALLCRARLLVGFVPLRRWRDSLGWSGDGGGTPAPCDGALREAAVLARHVERAATQEPQFRQQLERAEYP